MSIVQILLFGAGLMAMMVMGYAALSGPSPVKEGARRLQGLRERHSDSTKDRVEAQLRKAVAARKPKGHRIAGSSSRIEALALRLDRTGKPWTVMQYFYVSLGLALGIAVLIYLRSGAALLSLGIGVIKRSTSAAKNSRPELSRPAQRSAPASFATTKRPTR